MSELSEALAEMRRLLQEHAEICARTSVGVSGTGLGGLIHLLTSKNVITKDECSRLIRAIRATPDEAGEVEPHASFMRHLADAMAGVTGHTVAQHDCTGAPPTAYQEREGRASGKSAAGETGEDIAGELKQREYIR